MGSQRRSAGGLILIVDPPRLFWPAGVLMNPHDRGVDHLHIRRQPALARRL
jgi:hypothetical protein